MERNRRPLSPLRRKAKKGFRGFPVGTVAFFRQHGVKSVAMSDGLLGCPHEEGIDYPKGEACPQCPYWAGRDRFTGELIE